MSYDLEPLTITPDIIVAFLEDYRRPRMASWVRDAGVSLRQALGARDDAIDQAKKLLERLRQYEPDAGKVPPPVRSHRSQWE